MRFFALQTLLFGLILAPLTAVAKEAPISLAKASKWEINYDEDSCHLYAEFGDGDQSMILAITRVSTGDSFELRLTGKSLKYSTISMPIEVAFGDQQTPYKRTGIAVTSRMGPAVIVDGLWLDGWQFPNRSEEIVARPPITPQQEAAVTSITFRAAGGKRYRLETGSLGAPMAAMRTCTEDLLRHWGFDPAVQANLSKWATPRESPGRWLSSSDFPAKALSQGDNGLVRFRLDIDETGKAYGCRVLFRTRPDEFADVSCKLLLQRAKFTPALDATGKPVKSYFISAVRWMAGGW